jgi:hypothetical protein
MFVCLTVWHFTPTFKPPYRPPCTLPYTPCVSGAVQICGAAFAAFYTTIHHRIYLRLTTSTSVNFTSTAGVSGAVRGSGAAFVALHTPRHTCKCIEQKLECEQISLTHFYCSGLTRVLRSGGAVCAAFHRRTHVGQAHGARVGQEDRGHLWRTGPGASPLSHLPQHPPAHLPSHLPPHLPSDHVGRSREEQLRRSSGARPQWSGSGSEARALSPESSAPGSGAPPEHVLQSPGALLLFFRDRRSSAPASRVRGWCSGSAPALK